MPAVGHAAGCFPLNRRIAMPTIELTDEQAQSLIELVEDRMSYLNGEISRADPVEELDLKHQASELSDILELLEIA
jgi:hypothetical protein